MAPETCNRLKGVIGIPVTGKQNALSISISFHGADIPDRLARLCQTGNVAS